MIAGVQDSSPRPPPFKFCRYTHFSIPKFTFICSSIKIKVLAYQKYTVVRLPLCHHYPAVRWANKAPGRCDPTPLCNILLQVCGSMVRIAWGWCDQLKSSCFPRLTGSTAASCDTIWRLCAAQIICRETDQKAQVEGGARLCMPTMPYGVHKSGTIFANFSHLFTSEQDTEFADRKQYL